MNVTEMMAEAWKAVEASGVPKALQETAFREAMAVLSQAGSHKESKQNRGPRASAKASKSTSKAERAKPKQSVGVDVEPQLGLVLPDDELFAKFSAETGIPSDQLQEVFFFSDGKPILNGTTRQLGDNVAAQSRSVALAITSAYHFALGVRDVPSARIAGECKRKNCFDTDNFSSVMTREKSVSFVGERGNKIFRVRPGDTTVTALKTFVDSFRGVKATG